MTVAELIALLQQQDPEAEVLVTDPMHSEVLVMVPIDTVSTAESTAYGHAVLIELES